MRKTYYAFLKEEIDSFVNDNQEFDRVIMHLPDFFKASCDILDDEALLDEDRDLLNRVLSYLVLPNDVIPEEVYGPWGYMDDLFVCSHVLDGLYKKYPTLVLKYISIGKEEFESRLFICYNNTGKFLEQKNLKDKVLKSAGVKTDG